MSSSFGPIQEAIYTTLTGDAPLMSQITGVFDFVDENQAYPYVTLGETTSDDWSTFDRFGERSTATLHIWSRYDGFLEVTNIANDVNRLLVRQIIALTDYEDVGIWYDSMTTIVSPDTFTRHGVLRYRLLVLSNI